MRVIYHFESGREHAAEWPASTPPELIAAIRNGTHRVNFEMTEFDVAGVQDNTMHFRERGHQASA